MADERAPRQRRIGRDGILDVAADLLAQAPARDLIGVLGVRRLAEAAGVAVGTITHHFGRAAPDGRQSLPIATIRHALDRDVAEIAELTRDRLREAARHLRDGDREGLERIVQAAAGNLDHYSRASASQTALYLAAAAAPVDRVAADVAADWYAAVDDHYPDVYEELAEAFGRRFIESYPATDFAAVLSALVDGLITRQRLRADPHRQDLFTATALALFEVVTVPVTAPDPPDVSDRLLPVPAGSGLDQDRRVAIARAAAALYGREGWEAVTVAGVAREAQVSRAAVAAQFGDRHGLAAAIWAREMPSLTQALEEDEAAERPLEQLLWRHGQRLAEVTSEHPALTAGLLEGFRAAALSGGHRAELDPTDPRGIAPVHTLGTAQVLARRDELRAEVVGDGSGAGRFMAMVNRMCLDLALNDRSLPSAGVADTVVDALLRGALARTATHPLDL